MSSYDARLDRIEASSDPTGLPPIPTEEELQVEMDKLEADPSYACRWSAELVQSWTHQLEREIAEGS